MEVKINGKEMHLDQLDVTHELSREIISAILKDPAEVLDFQSRRLSSLVSKLKIIKAFEWLSKESLLTSEEKIKLDILIRSLNRSKLC